MSLPHAIMTALLDDNLTGYELARQFDVSLGFFWQASHQQIYRELKKLHDDDWLSVEEVPQAGKPDKRVYSLTPKGREALADWVLQPSKKRNSRDELLIRLYNLGQGQDECLIQAVAERREQSAATLALYRRIEQKTYADPATFSRRKQGIYLALRLGIRQEQTIIDWCDEARAILVVYPPA